MMDGAREQLLYQLANKLRILSVQATSDNPAGNSGHPTTCASCAEVVSSLFFNTMRYDWVDQRAAGSDRFILSKGHAAPILYAAWMLIEDALLANGQLKLREAGPNQTELITNLRKTGHKYEGHPTPKLPFVDMATGSLGQGLSCGAGMAYAGKYVDKCDYKIYCLLGDGECAEGAVYEAMAFAAHYNLNNLIAIVDLNRLGQSEATMYEHDTDLVSNRWRAFGWDAIVVDGHDVNALVAAYNSAGASSKPLAIIAKTFKGRGFENVEDKLNWHGKPLSDPKKFIAALEATLPDGAIKLPRPEVPKNPATNLPDRVSIKSGIPAGTKKMATRKAYGISLAALQCDRVIACDAEVKNSTFSIDYKNAFPDRFVECFIAEQNLVGVTQGLACRDRTISFASTFGAFFARAYDHIRMGAISLSNANYVGSHCGVSIGTDGPSQMALEDLAIFRAVPNCTVLYPSDALSMEKAIEIVANSKGQSYIRTTREETPILYEGWKEPFAAGRSQVLKYSDQDRLVVIAAGITLFETIKAAETLAAEGINIRVVDLFSVKPLDVETISAAARACNNKIITVEDHYQQGGIGEAVAAALSETDVRVRIMAVQDIPCSGKGDELLDMFNIGARAIVHTVKSFL
jgi:transketolase